MSDCEDQEQLTKPATSALERLRARRRKQEAATIAATVAWQEEVQQMEGREEMEETGKECNDGAKACGAAGVATALAVSDFHTPQPHTSPHGSGIHQEDKAQASRVDLISSFESSESQASRKDQSGHSESPGQPPRAFNPNVSFNIGIHLVGSEGVEPRLETRMEQVMAALAEQTCSSCQLTMRDVQVRLQRARQRLKYQELRRAEEEERFRSDMRASSSDRRPERSPEDVARKRSRTTADIDSFPPARALSAIGASPFVDDRRANSVGKAAPVGEADPVGEANPVGSAGSVLHTEGKFAPTSRKATKAKQGGTSRAAKGTPRAEVLSDAAHELMWATQIALRGLEKRLKAIHKAFMMRGSTQIELLSVVGGKKDCKKPEQQDQFEKLLTHYAHAVKDLQNDKQQAVTLTRKSYNTGKGQATGDRARALRLSAANMEKDVEILEADVDAMKAVQDEQKEEKKRDKERDERQKRDERQWRHA